MTAAVRYGRRPVVAWEWREAGAASAWNGGGKVDYSEVGLWRGEFPTPPLDNIYLGELWGL